METPANGRRAVNRIVVTNLIGHKLRVFIDKIVIYSRHENITFITLGNGTVDVKETPEEIDKLIDEALGE